mgnify:FL=1
MIVIFQSESENKSINRVRKILDAYANRIGNNSWMTPITKEGLDTVYHELRRIATKDTAVSCLLVKGRVQSELLWIVGNRGKFDEMGNVPVNETSNNKYIVDDEESWSCLPIISSLVAIAALWHDIGKASDWFQNKLKHNKRIGDPLRHEWISCMLLFAYIKSVNASSDEEWLKALSENKICFMDIIQQLNRIKKEKNFFKQAHGYPVYSFVTWLILSHHRFPGAICNYEYLKKEYRSCSIRTIDDLLLKLKPQLGYETSSEEAKEKVFSFSKGISLFEDVNWKKEISKWANRLLSNCQKIKSYADNNSFYEILMLSRNALVLADHEQSSLKGSYSSTDNSSSNNLIANLYPNGKPNQSLSEHILGVEFISLRIVHYLPYIASRLPRSFDNKFLKGKATIKYNWQNKACEEIRRIKKSGDYSRQGCFVVNMASTGCGKTIANAKILQTLSTDDSLRCSILLGLRTLTLQTGEEYKTRLGLKEDDLSIVIGSEAYVELSNIDARKQNEDEVDEDSVIDLNDKTNDVITSFAVVESPLKEKVFDKKAINILYPPIMVSTIDQIIKASEETRGAHNIIAMLRLLSSDVVIDEVDDYSADDLVAIGRFVYLCGVFGRKVLISSATVPIEMSESLASAYQRGWAEYATLHGKIKQINCIFVDEFNSMSTVLKSYQDLEDEGVFRISFSDSLESFINKRVKRLEKIAFPRRGEIVPIKEKSEQHYFDSIIDEIKILHGRHSEKDPFSSKQISFGLVRFSNIKQCIKFSCFLDEKGLGEGIDIRFITYHAREVLLIRHAQERYLDKILCRKNPDEIFHDKIVRENIERSDNNEVVFIVVSSPVEELGRDHDFDWAIIEPASFRSIIQTSGRVLRHRESNNVVPNIGVMQFNWNALTRKDTDICYARPGFEGNDNLHLPSHDLYNLVDENELRRGITSIPRIRPCNDLCDVRDFCSLEHKHIQQYIGQSEHYQAYDFDSFYYTPVMLTAFSQRFHPFRKSTDANIRVFLINRDGSLHFCQNINGEWNNVDRMFDIDLSEINKSSSNDWLNLSYINLVDEYSNHMEKKEEEIEKIYGELCFSKKEGKRWKYTNRFGLEEIDCKVMKLF